MFLSTDRSPPAVSLVGGGLRVHCGRQSQVNLLHQPVEQSGVKGLRHGVPRLPSHLQWGVEKDVQSREPSPTKSLRMSARKQLLSLSTW